MKRISPIVSFLLILIFSHQIQGQDEFVELTGKVYNAKDSGVIATSILYEKLPYYDDMGLASSSAEGNFKFILIKDLNYILTIEEENFEKYSNEIQVVDGGNSQMSLDIYLTPAKIDVDVLITLDDLTFRRGSATIQESSNASLDEFAQYLKDRPNITIQLEGHTDIQGNPQANFDLSQARVDAVSMYLVKQGIKKNRITTKAFGGTVPLTTERTPEAMAKNRRVEVRLFR